MKSFRHISITGIENTGFNVMSAFSELDGPRKMALFDRLNDSKKTFYKTVTLFWPQAQPKDCRELERFIVQRLAANDV